LVGGEGAQRLAGAELALQAVEGLLVRAAGGGGQVGLGQERRSRLAQQPDAGGEGDDPAGHGGSLGRWQGMRQLRRLPRWADIKVTASG